VGRRASARSHVLATPPPRGGVNLFLGGITIVKNYTDRVLELCPDASGIKMSFFFRNYEKRYEGFAKAIRTAPPLNADDIQDNQIYNAGKFKSGELPLFSHRQNSLSYINYFIGYDDLYLPLPFGVYVSEEGKLKLPIRGTDVTVDLDINKVGNLYIALSSTVNGVFKRINLKNQLRSNLSPLNEADMNDI